MSKEESIRVSILNLLKSSINVKITFGIIKHYNLGYTDRQIKNVLTQMSMKGYVRKLGRRRSFIYQITEKGLDYLLTLERRKLIPMKRRKLREELEYDMKVALDKYLIMLDGGTDL